MHTETTCKGSCHCGSVTFEATMSPVESAMSCNCSYCSRKGTLLVFIPRKNFSITNGEDALTEYRFNTKKIAHQFCSVCGTTTFGFGADTEGNETAAINVRCLHDIDLDALKIEKFNGKDF